MKLQLSPLFLLCLILCGCSTVTSRNTSGRDFDETKITQIKKGVTTADGVVVLYGEPGPREHYAPGYYDYAGL